MEVLGDEGAPPTFSAHAFITGQVNIPGVRFDALMKMQKESYYLCLSGKVGESWESAWKASESSPKFRSP